MAATDRRLDRNEILNYMRQASYKPMSAEELAQALEVRNLGPFLALLGSMEADGDIVLTRKHRYGIPERMGLVVGCLQGHPRGYAFLIPDDAAREDVFVPRSGLNGAMHRDRVIVRINRSAALAGGQAEGEVIRILKRGSQRLVGTFERVRQHGFVAPDDQRIGTDILIPRGAAAGAKPHDKVVVEITAWPSARRGPEGRVVEVLGREGEPGVDVLSIIKQHDLPLEFPAAVLAEAKKVPQEVTAFDRLGRRDLRDLLMVTIDGEDAKDLDDAVSLVPEKGNTYQLGVHIADVSYYVREGSRLDAEAFRRGTSVYLVDRVIPMLPPQLSNGICSLNAGVDRLALSVLMRVSYRGRVLDYEIVPSVIHVHKRLTYNLVRQLIEEKDRELRQEHRELVPMLERMGRLATALRQKRLAGGAIDFDLPEAKVILDERGRPKEVVRAVRSLADQIIEEFMILANETVARHLEANGLPGVYRVHEDPDPEKISNLNKFLGPLGYHIRGDREGVKPWHLQQVAQAVAGKPEARAVNMAMLRSLKHARYAPQSLGHFGLAKQYYCHFTSPIRRYPDLVVHRVLREVMEKGALSPQRNRRWQEMIHAYAQRSSERERAAEEAERDSVDMKKVEYMERHVGGVFSGFISGVTAYGFYVELDNTVEGLVHISTLTDDYYRFDEEHVSLVGQHTGRTFRLGDPVQVRVLRADRATRQIDMELAQPGIKAIHAGKLDSSLIAPGGG